MNKKSDFLSVSKCLDRLSLLVNGSDLPKEHQELRDKLVAFLEVEISDLQETIEVSTRRHLNGQFN